MTTTLHRPAPTAELAIPSGLKGLSDEQLIQHYKLYQGYVANAAKLQARLQELRSSGRAAATNPEFAEVTRRLGFELNGKRMHELYFGNLKADGGVLPPDGPLAEALARQFGTTGAWEDEFRQVCGLRGVGWAVLYQDPDSLALSNHWIGMHEDGHVVGYRPILVVDVWEHAFTVDLLPTQRTAYVDAIFQNIDWRVVESRLLTA